MFKKILIILVTGIVLSAMSFSFLACEEKLPTSEELIEKLIEAQLDVKSYEMEGSAVLDMTLDIPEEDMSMGMPTDVGVVVDITGAFDTDDEKMMMVMNMDIDMAGEATMKMGMEMYLLDDWMYMMVDAPMMSPQWTKTEVSYNEILEKMESIDFTQTQTELLESADIVITGKEKIDGIDCYILEVSPDMSKLLEILMQQSQLTGGDMLNVPTDEFDEMMENIDDMVKNISATYWVAEDTFYIIKGDVSFSMEITPEAMGVTDEEGSVSMDTVLSMRMFNHDKPVSIVLPPEAENAVEESIW
jgi:hypothetical protein